MKKRILALLLCVLSMVNILFPYAYASEDYSADVGKYAQLNSYYADSTVIVHDGSSDFAMTDAMMYDYAEFEEGLIFCITDWYLDTVNSALWYQVEAYQGNLPADMPAGYWIFQNYVGDDSEEDTLLFVTVEPPEDKTTVTLDGVAVSEVAMPKYNKPVLNAASTLTGTVSYRWQILADVDTDLWVDIYGEDTEALKLSYAKVASLLNSDNQAWVRCVSSADGEEVPGEAVCVTVLPPEGAVALASEEPVSAVEQTDFVASVGEESRRTFLADASDVPDETVEDETIKKYILSIEYVYADSSIHAGTAVAPTWSAQISSKEPYVAVIPSPSVLGYTPDQASISFNYPIGALTSDVQIVVKYSPAVVDYSVKHYWQNINDDNYTLHETETKEGYTESVTPDTLHLDGSNVKYAGFEAMPYVVDTIAADGSTLVEIYYDRLYYLMTFELDGGYGTLPIYARYGTEVTIPDPTKVGYTFQGWDSTGDGKVDATPKTVPNYNSAYTAVWKPDDMAKVTFVFWGENADDTQYSYYGSDSSLFYEPGTNVTYRENGALICDHHIHGPACGYTCGKEQHTHQESCYDKDQLVCTKDEHTVHTDACYDCGQEAHAHDNCEVTCGHPPHTAACYGGTTTATLVNTYQTAISRVNDGATNPQSGYVYHIYRWNRVDNYYLYYNGQWYQVDENAVEGNSLGSGTYNNYIAYKYKAKLDCTHPVHQDSCYDCGKAAHTHSDSCGYKDELHTHTVDGGCYQLICTKEEHDHAEVGCNYACGMTEGTHNNSCYNSLKTMDPDYWDFEKADVKEVEADGTTVINVYYTRTTRTLHFRKTNSDIDDYGSITAKWGESISASFNAITDKAGSSFWSYNRYGNQPYTNYMATMPKDPAYTIYYNSGKSGSSGSMFYYGQDFEGNYNVLLHEVKNVGGYTVSDEDRYLFQGFEYDHGTNNNQSCKDATFYYNRLSYDLTFNNGEKDLQTVKVLFEDNLSDYKGYVPTEVPREYEPGSVYFDGWYLNPECTEDKKVDMDAFKMPAEPKVIYAKWSPVVHTVHVYRYKNADGSFPTNPTDILLEDHKVPHGSLIQDQYIPEKPADTERYKFDGWFYMDADGNEQAFDFHNIPVTRDLNIYAKWKTDMIMDVTVQYVTVENGVEVEIAKQETFSAYVGTLKTYEAKTENQLYDGYQTKYYPNTASSSITVSEDESQNVLKFYYVYMEDVPYSVEYWIEDGDGTLRPAFRKVDTEPGYEFVGDTIITESEAYIKRVENHGKAVVTEDYIRVDKYRPDALQHRLIITSDEKENVIKFIYTYDPKAAFYTVNYYILKPGVTTPASAADYDLYTNTQSVGTVGQTYSSQPIEIPGTTFSEVATVAMKEENTWDSANQTLSAVLAGDNSTHLDFFYTRNPYPYQVRYVTEGRDLTTPKTTDGDGNQLQAQYGATVTESALEFEGYKVDAVSKSHTIQIGTAAQNTIIFYYTRMTGDLKITKSVMLDEEQAKEDSSLKLPDNADTIPFNFTVSGAEALHKSSYAYTITRKNGTVEKGTVKVDAGSYGKALEPISLCDGDSVVIHGLALGTYTVAEEHVIGYKTTINGVESEHLDLTLDADGKQVTADVVNTYPFFTGDLVLSKTIKKLSDTDPDGTGEIFTFTITVTPAEGTLEEQRIIKFFTLDEDGNPVESQYSIPAKGYGESYTFSLRLKAGETVTVSDIPAGTFKVVETIDEEHYATEYYKVTYDKKNNINTQVTGTSDTVNGEIHGGHATEVGYKNTYKKGGLTIQKTVTQEMSYDGWQSDTFTFRVTGTTMLPDGDYAVMVGETPATATVTDGNVTMNVDPQVAVTRDGGWNNSVTITNLPAGIYTVEEIDAGLGMAAYTSTPGSRKVENLKLPESATAEFHNMFLRSSGDLYISKTISIVPGSGAEIDPKAEFTFTVVMPEDGDFESKTYTGIDQDNATKDFTVVDGKFTFKLKHGQSMLLQDLPVGSYTVTEAPASGYASSFPVASADGYVQVTQDVKMNQETRLECVNTFPVYVGNLIIRKTVTQESTLDTLPDDEFAFQIHLGIAHAGKAFQAEGAKTTVTADANGIIAVSLKNGEYIHIKNLPEGNCTVTESLTAQQQEKYQPSYKVNSEAKTAGTVAHINIASGQDNTVIYDNLYLRQRTELTITKTNAADEEQVFVYEVKNKTTGEVITVTVVGNGSTTIHDLPFGEYTVTQKNGWSWRFLDPAEDVTLDKNDRESGEEVTFVQPTSINKWLDGNSWLIRNRKKGGT